jgi:dihydroneopterin aldolase
MGEIALEGMEFFAYHGHYDEEQKIGNKYGVDLYISTDLGQAAGTDKLQQTVDYEKLYQLVREEMKLPSRLLEHIGQRIIEHTLQAFPHIQEVRVVISKFNPPLGGICHRAKVTLSSNRIPAAP